MEEISIFSDAPTSSLSEDHHLLLLQVYHSSMISRNCHFENYTKDAENTEQHVV